MNEKNLPTTGKFFTFSGKFYPKIHYFSHSAIKQAFFVKYVFLLSQEENLLLKGGGKGFGIKK